MRHVGLSPICIAFSEMSETHMENACRNLKSAAWIDVETFSVSPCFTCLSMKGNLTFLEFQMQLATWLSAVARPEV